MKQKPLSRRRFLAGASAAGVAMAMPRGSRAAPANSRLAHACIGVDGMGAVDLRNFRSHPGAQIVALCDVDESHLKQAAAECPGVRTYTDWRELLAAEGDRLDSVNAAVPDHMHAAITMAALRAGKHVYCQKPLCHDVAEARAVREAAAAAQVVTQLGTQHASGIGDRLAVHHLRAGTVGKIRRVLLCSNRPGAVAHYRLVGPRPAPSDPPAVLHWDLWLGTAPARPYAPGVYHPTLWRSWQDFGTGWSGDIGCHIFDAVWKGLELQAPRSVQAEVQASWRESPARRAETWPQANHITWVFPGNHLTEGDELVIEWFDGEFYPPADVRALYPGDKYPAESAMVLGTEGALLLPHTSGPLLLPRDRFKGVPRPDLPPRNHYHHFVDACRGGEMTESHFGISGPMAETVLLGTVAVRVPGQRLEWDAAALRFPNHPPAEQFLRRRYRAGWESVGL